MSNVKTTRTRPIFTDEALNEAVEKSFAAAGTRNTLEAGTHASVLVNGRVTFSNEFLLAEKITDVRFGFAKAGDGIMYPVMFTNSGLGKGTPVKVVGAESGTTAITNTSKDPSCSNISVCKALTTKTQNVIPYKALGYTVSDSTKRGTVLNLYHTVKKSDLPEFNHALETVLPMNTNVEFEKIADNKYMIYFVSDFANGNPLNNCAEGKIVATEVQIKAAGKSTDFANLGGFEGGEAVSNAEKKEEDNEDGTWGE